MKAVQIGRKLIGFRGLGLESWLRCLSVTVVDSIELTLGMAHRGNGGG